MIFNVTWLSYASKISFFCCLLPVFTQIYVVAVYYVDTLDELEVFGVGWVTVVHCYWDSFVIGGLERCFGTCGLAVEDRGSQLSFCVIFGHVSDGNCGFILFLADFLLNEGVRLSFFYILMQ